MLNMKKTMATLLAVVCISSSTFCLTVDAASYSSTKAVNYAVTWAESFNSNYTKQDQDCTNFVSQCISAGNVPYYYSIASGLIGNLKSGCSSGRSDEWYHIKNKNKENTWSSTWTVVDKSGSKDGLHRYLGKSKKTTYKKTDVSWNKDRYKDIHVGDVIQLSYDKGSTYGHSIIVSKIENKEVYYCGHTSARKNYKLSSSLSYGGNNYISIYTPSAN